MPSAEILAVLADEVTDAQNAIGASFDGLCSADGAVFADAKASYVEQVQRIGAACSALGLRGLYRGCSFIEDNVNALDVGGLNAERRELFERWPSAMHGYLRAPRDKATVHELSELLRHPAWPEPLDGSTHAELEQALFDVGEHELDAVETTPARQTQARAEDVVLSLPQDVNSKLVDAFLTEGPQQASEYSALIQGVAHADVSAEDLGECRRLIHALKGAANTVGVRGIAALCHHTEDILEFLVESSAQPEAELGRLLVKVADTLEGMFEALLGTADAPDDAQAVLQSVLDAINRIEQGEYASNAESHAPPTAVEAAHVEERPTANMADRVEPRVRVPARVLDSMLWTSGEIAISNSHVQERLKHALTALAELRERQEVLRERGNDMESFATTQGIAAGRRHVLAAGSDVTASSGFDPLELDQYNELHVYARAITETAADLQLLGADLMSALATVTAAVNQQTLLNNELHDLLMTARMVSARNFDSRLQRTVRQAAEQCGKQVVLHVEGMDLMLDDQLVNLLIDPLQHLLRNAVDHGIEAPSTRAALGKPETGNIHVGFARDGNYLTITCHDDGAGLDLARIRSHALARGVVTADQNLADDEVAGLILRPGFSTADEVTEVSGRGVGMDIVHAAVLKLKGSMDIRTTTGRGATFRLRVPMSLGIVHCLLVVAGGQTFALPSDNLERIVYGGASYVQRAADGARFKDDELNCPAYFLADLAGLADAGPEVRPVVLMKGLTGKTAIVVDAVRGGSNLVVKSMGRYLSGVKGVTGASILGDGGVVPILDLVDLIRSDFVPLRAAAESAVPAVSSSDVLIVDDSLSVRTALSILLNDAGFKVRLAKDGVEAIEAINTQLPAVVLADLEMPRMNGLELTAHLRTNARTQDLPVIMVTSRTAEKHRTQATAAGVNDYLTKPYRESDLLARVRTLISQKAA